MSVAIRNSMLAGCMVTVGLLLGGCNMPGVPGLNGSAGAGTSEVQALVEPRGITGPGSNVLEAAKAQYRERNFGLAEQQFRAIVEKEPGNAEGWLGLAAAYDQLRRFELADRAYEQVGKLAGSSAVLHNNRGYSYLLRGNRDRARGEFAAARRLDPNNAFIQNNLSAASGRS